MTGYPTSIGSSDESTIQLLGQDLAADLMGQVGFGELAFWLVAMRRPDAGRAAGLRGRAGGAGRPRPHALGDRRPAHPHRCARVGAGRAGGRAARRRLALPRRDRGRRPLPRRAPWPSTQAGGATLPDDRRGLGRPRPRRRAARSRPPVAGARASGTPCTRPATRARRCCCGSPTRRACSGRTCGCSRPSAGCTPRCSAAPCRSTAPASAARPCATSASRVEILRGFALLARAAGLLGHLAEEMRRPIGLAIYDQVDRAAEYQPAGRSG